MSMSDDQMALLRAVISQPDDDYPRLLMADWFREHGQWDRGEFIAIQCELARLPKSHQCCDCHVCKDRIVKTCRWCQLRARERELLSLGEWAMLDHPLTEILHRFALGLHWPSLCQFRRGFCEEITCSWDDWRQHADSIRAATPLKKVRLTTRLMLSFHFDLSAQQERTVDHAPEALSLMYPGIKFEFPPPQFEFAGYAATYTPVSQEEFESALRRATEHMEWQPPLRPSHRVHP